MPLRWTLLSSRLPRDPSRLRLAVWRRLKRLGAVLIHDAVWMLPADSKTREAFEWLAEEIEEQGGTVWVWEAAGLSQAQDREAVETFRRQADARYAEIERSARAIHGIILRARRPSVAKVAQALRQLRGLERALRLERRRDYFRAAGQASAAAEVRDAIVDLEGRVPVPSTQEGAARALGD